MDNRLMTALEQLELWITGRPVHNGPTQREGDCCPDFSCCRGVEKMAPRDVRIRFTIAYRTGDENTVDQLSMMFLLATLSDDLPGTRVYVTGGHPEAKDFTEH